MVDGVEGPEGVGVPGCTGAGPGRGGSGSMGAQAATVANRMRRVERRMITCRLGPVAGLAAGIWRLSVSCQESVAMMAASGREVRPPGHRPVRRRPDLG